MSYHAEKAYTCLFLMRRYDELFAANYFGFDSCRQAIRRQGAGFIMKYIEAASLLVGEISAVRPVCRTAPFGAAW